MSAPPLQCPRTFEKNLNINIQQQLDILTDCNTAQTKYIYCITCTKENSDESATGNFYTDSISRAGVFNINVSMQKMVKNKKTIGILTETLLQKKRKNKKKISSINVYDYEYH